MTPTPLKLLAATLILSAAPPAWAQLPAEHADLNRRIDRMEASFPAFTRPTGNLFVLLFDVARSGKLRIEP